MYIITRYYSDGTTCELATCTIDSIFNSCAIYIADPDCKRITVKECGTMKTIVDYKRP